MRFLINLQFTHSKCSIQSRIGCLIFGHWPSHITGKCIFCHTLMEE